MTPQKKTLARKPIITSLTPAALQALINGHAKRRPIDLHAPLTKLKMRETETFWKQFCSHMSYGDPDDALKNLSITPSIILGYLAWRVNESRFEGHRRITVRHWWKLLSQLSLFKFREATSLEARKTVREALTQGGYLITKCRLNTDSKEKPVVGSDDYYDILITLHTALLKQLYMRNERQRFQLWLFEHIAAYTGSRPGALVSRRQDFLAIETLPEADELAIMYNNNELLRYRHYTLTLLPGETGGESKAAGETRAGAWRSRARAAVDTCYLHLISHSTPWNATAQLCQHNYSHCRLRHLWKMVGLCLNPFSICEPLSPTVIL